MHNWRFLEGLRHCIFYKYLTSTYRLPAGNLCVHVRGHVHGEFFMVRGQLPMIVCRLVRTCSSAMRTCTSLVHVRSPEQFRSVHGCVSTQSHGTSGKSIFTCGRSAPPSSYTNHCPQECPPRPVQVRRHPPPAGVGAHVYIFAQHLVKPPLLRM